MLAIVLPNVNEYNIIVKRYQWRDLQLLLF